MEIRVAIGRIDVAKAGTLQVCLDHPRRCILAKAKQWFAWKKRPPRLKPLAEIRHEVSPERDLVVTSAF